jgi:hypothetical protein
MMLYTGCELGEVYKLAKTLVELGGDLVGGRIC